MFETYNKEIDKFIFLIIVFLVCREIICWYWKINLANRSLKQHTIELVAIKGLLKKILDKLEPTNSKIIKTKEPGPDIDNAK